MTKRPSKVLTPATTELESASSFESISFDPSTTSLQLPASISALVQTPQELGKLSAAVALAPGLMFK